MVTTKEVADAFLNTGVEYFNTFGGNPVSCAIASAVLDVIEDENVMILSSRINNIKHRSILNYAFISFPFYTPYHIIFLVDGTCQRCGRVSEASIPRIEKETHGIH